MKVKKLVWATDFNGSINGSSGDFIVGRILKVNIKITKIDFMDNITYGEVNEIELDKEVIQRRFDQFILSNIAKED